MFFLCLSWDVRGCLCGRLNFLGLRRRERFHTGLGKKPNSSGWGGMIGTIGLRRGLGFGFSIGGLGWGPGFGACIGGRPGGFGPPGLGPGGFGPPGLGG
jgi:hypothetical protein